MKELHLLALDYRCAVLPDDAHKAWIELEEYVKQLINEEREACAKLCEESDRYRGEYFAKLIR